MRRQLSPGAVVVAGAAAALAGFAAHATASRSAETRAASRPLTVSSALPRWRAPGVAVPVSGFATAHERVVLRANGRRVDSALSGKHGRYRLRFAADRPGRYRLSVGTADRFRTVGTVVVRRVVLAAVGDITFGEQVGPAIANYGARYPWVNVARSLRQADITVGNLETAVSTRGLAAVKEYTFRGPPDALRPLHGFAGFDVLTLANNHSVDYGRDALEDTIRYVHAAGIKTIGAGPNSFRARRPAVIERGGLRVAFLGYSDVNPAGFPATATGAGTAAADTTAIAADVRAARRRADVVVCFFHFGVELRADPDSRQRTLASACLDAGATVVLGAHPHVLGPVSRPSPSTLVAWTLGNFVFPSGRRTAHSAILRVELGKSRVDSYRLVPVTIEGFRPRLAATD